ncbi:unnamed protein product [Soboliphyme baturini]|uniref:CBS domain-containing protein n=1 Tax=Soboliphyme baturini TaxID=241478 RepID=A0A183JAY1_9BILA|nr:unnamed protein product [Soboliphyme baturini]
MTISEHTIVMLDPSEEAQLCSALSVNNLFLREEERVTGIAGILKDNLRRASTVPLIPNAEGIFQEANTVQGIYTPQ